jgi:hypothetical protein
MYDITHTHTHTHTRTHAHTHTHTHTHLADRDKDADTVIQTENKKIHAKILNITWYTHTHTHSCKQIIRLYLHTKIRMCYMLTYGDVWWRMLTYADVCWRMYWFACTYVQYVNTHVLYALYINNTFIHTPSITGVWHALLFFTFFCMACWRQASFFLFFLGMARRYFFGTSVMALLRLYQGCMKAALRLY